MNFQLSNVDFIIMILYAVAIIAYGLYHAKRKSSEEYFLGGRNSTWPVIGISLFAANISSSTLIGLAGAAYALNTHVFNYEWFAVVVLIFFAIFFLPFYLRSKVYTMPEFLERRYSAHSRYYFSGVTVVGHILIDTAASLYVGSLMLKLIFPEVSPSVIIMILALAAAAYTIPGGLNSVIQTEVVQAILLIIGSIILTWFAFDKVGGWSGMIDGLNAKNAAGEISMNAKEALSMVRPTDDEYMPWYGLLTGVPLLGFYFWANNQFMVQRVLSAKDLNHGRWGALFAGFLKLPVIFFMVIPGVLALLLYSKQEFAYKLDNGTLCQNLADCPDYTYLTLLFDLLPTGILSATFNSASTLITMDFVNKIRPNMTNKQLVRTGQIATLILVILASLWAPQIGKYGDLFEYLQVVLSYIAPPIVSTFLLGLFWKRANASGSFISLLAGFAMAIFFLYGQYQGVEDGFLGMHFLLRSFVLMLICMVVHIIVSLSTAKPDISKVKDYTWRRELFTQETEDLKALPWYQNYRILSIFLLILTAAIVGYFW